MAHTGLSLAQRGFTEGGKFAKGHRYFPAEHDNPRKRQCTQQLISQLNEVCKDKKFAGKTNLVAIIEALIARAMQRDIDAIREIFNRVEGKPSPALPFGERADHDDVEFTVTLGSVQPRVHSSS